MDSFQASGLCLLSEYSHPFDEREIQLGQKTEAHFGHVNDLDVAANVAVVILTDWLFRYHGLVAEEIQ